jgi:hypothetical protein
MAPKHRYELPPLRMQLIGLCALLGATVVVFWAALSPAHFELEVALDFACLGVALYLAIFFYIFWPQPDLDAVVKPWWATKEFRVTGPIILLFLAFGILKLTIAKPPDRIYAQVFAPDEPVLYDRNTRVDREDSKPLTYHLVRDRVRPDWLEGVYIEFPKGENTIEACFTHNEKGKRVFFTRGKGNFETKGECHRR